MANLATKQAEILESIKVAEQINEVKEETCIFCDESHKKEDCILRIKGKYVRLNEKGICSKCFIHEHGFVTCTAAPCQPCQGSHHTLLCKNTLTTNWCSFCGNTSHMTSVCPLYLADKRQGLRQQHRCFKCFGKHRTEECQSENCRNCLEPHYTLICLNMLQHLATLQVPKPWRKEENEETTQRESNSSSIIRRSPSKMIATEAAFIIAILCTAINTTSAFQEELLSSLTVDWKLYANYVLAAIAMAITHWSYLNTIIVVLWWSTMTTLIVMHFVNERHKDHIACCLLPQLLDERTKPTKEAQTTTDPIPLEQLEEENYEVGKIIRLLRSKFWKQQELNDLDLQLLEQREETRKVQNQIDAAEMHELEEASMNHQLRNRKKRIQQRR